MKIMLIYCFTMCKIPLSNFWFVTFSKKKKRNPPFPTTIAVKKLLCGTLPNLDQLSPEVKLTNKITLIMFEKIAYHVCTVKTLELYLCPSSKVHSHPVSALVSLKAATHILMHPNWKTTKLCTFHAELQFREFYLSIIEIMYFSVCVCLLTIFSYIFIFIKKLVGSIRILQGKIYNIFQTMYVLLAF